jgi:Lysylphosphatidylglycerol synthase TM region
MKLSRNIKIFFNYILGPVLFVWLSFSIYLQIRNQENIGTAWKHIRDSVYSTAIWQLAAVVLLMLVNWGIEAYKWKISVQNIQPISFGKAFKAILSGVSFSVTTPNRMGEYVGRLLYMEEGNRLRTISLTMVSSISQLIITLLMGLTGLIVLLPALKKSDMVSGIDSSLWLQVIIYGVAAVLLILTLFYFRLGLITRLFEKFSGSRRYIYLVKALEDVHATLLLRLLSLSLLRFTVFCIQYYLLFRLFDVGIGWWQSFWSVSIAFLVLAVIPSFAIAELGIRGRINLKILGLFSVNHLGITIATVSVWLINLIVPAVIGSVLILSIKVFKNRNEKNKTDS